MPLPVKMLPDAEFELMALSAVGAADVDVDVDVVVVVVSGIGVVAGVTISVIALALVDVVGATIPSGVMVPGRSANMAWTVTVSVTGGKVLETVTV